MHKSSKGNFTTCWKVLIALTVAMVSGAINDGLNAAEIDAGSSNTTLRLIGEIENGDYEKMLNAIRTSDSFPGQLVLSSPGGDVVTAMKIGRFVRRAAMSVVLHRQGECNSACFLVMVGGVERVFNIPVGVHRPYYDRELTASLSPSESEAYYKSMDKELRRYMHEMDVPSRTIDYIMEIRSSTLEYLSPKDLIKMVGTMSPSHEEWLFAKCGISMSDAIGSERESTPLTDEHFACWNDALDEYHESVYQELISQDDQN